MKNLTKLILVTVAILSLASGKAHAQSEYNVLSFATNEMYNKYLLHKMYTQYANRDSAFYTPMSKAKAEAYGKRAKAGYIKILGNLPDKTPLNAVITASYDLGECVMENVIYESSPNRHVTANLYRPKKSGKYPAIIMLCGHSSSGKISNGERANGARYAANGIITMVIDPVSQGERNQIIDANGYQLARGGTTEHTLLFMNSLPVGESTVKDELWDNTRGIDYLISRDDVDSERIGAFGFSGGGTQSMYALAYDDRIKVAGVGGFFSQRRRSIEVLGAADGCQHIPGEGAQELELTDFLSTFAPKPLVIVGGNYCFVDRIGAEKGFFELQNIYNAYGAKENVFQYLGDDGHAFPKDKQDVVLGWFVKYLAGGDKIVEPVEVKPLSTQQMICTKRGNLSEYLPNEVLIPRRNAILWDQNAAVRAEFVKNPIEKQREIIKNVANINYKGKIAPETRGTIQRGTYTIEKLIIHAPDETPLPCLVFVPNQIKANAKVIVFAHDLGKANFAGGAEKLEILCGDGNVVIAADLRGIGETTDKVQRNDPKYYNGEYTNGITAMHIGESLVAQRTKDFLMIFDYISAEPRFSKIGNIEVEAFGKCSVPALHAAALDNRVKSMNIYSDITSWKNIIDNPTMWETISYIVPSAGLHYDITDLVASLRKRNIAVTVNK